MDKEELRKRMSKAIGTFENQMVRNITGTCAEIAVNYFTEQKLNIASVRGSDSGAVDTVAERWLCDYAHHNSDLVCFGYCTECKGEEVRESSDGQP